MKSSTRSQRAFAPHHGRLPGVPLAAIMSVNFYKALTPNDLEAVVAYLRSIPPVPNEVLHLQSTNCRVRTARDPYPDAERTYTDEAHERSCDARPLFGDHRALHGMPFGSAARGFRLRQRAWKRWPTVPSVPNPRPPRHMGGIDGPEYHL